ncbi:hypothetical protein GF326_02890 [Candidatus Bathyarchaeota archaeon]|jgi:hypothetical protein|nr:hypothetical protein [Candidatus Bathyarchaeota archaeon]
MSFDFLDEIVVSQDIKRRDLLEKDIILHSLLHGLMAEPWFREGYLFKGGTCLIKCFLGYYRFSEDLDFTYSDQAEFNGLSVKEIRRKLSKVIDKLGGLLEAVAGDVGLEFKCKKSDIRFVELGGSNRFCTFKLWYRSVDGLDSFVKVQFNFVELLYFPHRQVVAGNVMGDSGREIVALYPEASSYFEDLSLRSYDPKEILCEKVRALLTRRGVKARDYVDLFMLSEKLSLNVDEYIDCITQKTRHMLSLYRKYRVNLVAKRKLLMNGGLFEWGSEEALMLVPLDSVKFYRFVDELEEVLVLVLNRL